MKPVRGLWRLALVLAALSLLVAACGDADDGEGDDTTAAPATTGAVATTQPADTTAAPDTTAAAADTTAAPDTTAAAMDFGGPVTLNLGHPFPAQHPIQVNALEPFAAAVNAETDGAVTIEFHAGGSLADAPATFENTVVGGQELGWALQGYHAGVFPVTEIIEQPFQFVTAEQATQTLWDLYDEFPALQDEYSDVKLLALWVHDIGDLWTKDREVRTLEDVQGLTLRFPTPIMGQVIERMGGSPVGMPAPQIFDSLSTGVIDGLMIAVSGLQSFQLYPELSYGTECDCYVAAQYLVMNSDAWNSLTPDAQAVIERLGREMSFTAAEVYDAAYVSVSEIAESEGIEKYVLPDDELARWQAVGQEVTAEWIAAREAEGVPAQEMYDRMQEIKTQYAN